MYRPSSRWAFLINRTTAEAGEDVVPVLLSTERMREMYYYSNEIVFRGHPDKVCDQISAAILKACMQQDPYTRAGIETVGGKGKVFITGEVTTKARIDVKKIAADMLREIGYDPDRYEIIDNIGMQSADIAMGVDKDGAGDQGMMFGYACWDTPEKLPVAMVILQKLAMRYEELRKTDKRFLPDGKAQITGAYERGQKLVGIKTFTISYQNTEIEREDTDRIIKDIAAELAAEYGLKIEEFLVNPTGKFEIGGFDGDAGLTGRKIVVDAYQSFANVGGGCLNGKDPTKVDFSAAHKARQIAKRYIGEHRWCEVQLSYAIGISRPLAIYIETDAGEIEAPDSLYEECRPSHIIDDLDLRHADYVELAKYGHFRD